MRVDPMAYRQVMGWLATGVTVLTTSGVDHPEVMTANAVTSVSLEPVLLLAGVGRGCSWSDAARASGRFVVNVLSDGQEDLSRWCAGRQRHADPAAVLQHPHRGTQHGLVFTDALASFACRLHSDIPVGDHDLLVGEVEDMWVRDAGEPLLYFAGQYAGIGPARARELSLVPAAACS